MRPSLAETKAIAPADFDRYLYVPISFKSAAETAPAKRPEPTYGLGRRAGLKSGIFKPKTRSSVACSAYRSLAQREVPMACRPAANAYLAIFAQSSASAKARYGYAEPSLLMLGRPLPDAQTLLLGPGPKSPAAMPVSNNGFAASA